MTITSTPDLAMTIGGERRSADASFPVLDPATGELFAQAPDCSRALLDDAIAAAAGAFADWRRDDEARRDALRGAARALAAGAAELAPLLSREQGKPLRRSALSEGAADEIFYSGLWLDFFADLDVPRDVRQDDAAGHVEIVRRPFGVVAAITPWNYPLLMACWKLAPALRAGNTVVLKPSPYTPLATLRMVELMSEALPPGVLNVVSGGDELGAWLTAHPRVRKISFTGSVATGKRVAGAAAADLKRVTLELGGNDAAIVLDDADPAAVAEQLLPAAFENAGQRASQSSACTSRSSYTTSSSRRSRSGRAQRASAPARRRASSWAR